MNALCVTGRLLLTRINIHIGHCLMMPFRMGRWSRKRYRGNQKIIYCNRNIPLFETSFSKRGVFPLLLILLNRCSSLSESPQVLYEQYKLEWFKKKKKFLHKMYITQMTCLKDLLKPSNCVKQMPRPSAGHELLS